MQSLRDPEQNLALVARLRSLRPDSPRQWGRMSPAQACAHCQVGLQVALGDRTLKRMFMGRLFGGRAKRAITAPKPFGKNLPTDANMRVRDERDLETERDTLIGLVQRFGFAAPEEMDGRVHSFFGPLTAAEWDTLMWRHIDHHARQFGV